MIFWILSISWTGRASTNCHKTAFDGIAVPAETYRGHFALA